MIVYTCKNCGHEIRTALGKCKVCGYNNRKGLACPKEVRDKISESLKQTYKDDPTILQRMSESMKGNIPWNKGLTKETDERVKKNAEATSKSTKGRVRKPMIVTPESHEKRSLAKRGNLNPAKRADVRLKISNTIKNTYKLHPEILQNRKPSGKNQYSNYYTDIEQKIVDVLNKYNIGYTHNTKVGRYFADFIIFDKVIIECDGSHWHQDKTKDAVKNSAYHRDGYFVFRLSDTRIFESPESCVMNIIDIMNHLDPDIISNITGVRYEYCNTKIKEKH